MVKIARILFVFFTVMMVLSSCDNGKSYADLLKEEDKAVKAFLADKIVINSIPADSVFVTLQDVGNNDTLAVPYYRLDDDGNVYMQVLDAGQTDNRFEKGQDVLIILKSVSVKLRCHLQLNMGRVFNTRCIFSAMNVKSIC